MATNLYIGDASGKARKVSKVYVGDANGKAREVKKGYVGDASGTARLFYQNAPVKQFRCDLKNAVGGLNRNSGSMGSIGNYALYAGGWTYTSGKATYYSTVNTLTTSLTRGTATSLPNGTTDASSANIGNYVIFSGLTNIYTAYNASLTRQTRTSGASYSYTYEDINGATFSNRACFYNYMGYLNTFNSSLTFTQYNAQGRGGNSGGITANNNYIFMANDWYDGSYASDTYAFNTSFTRMANVPQRLAASNTGVGTFGTTCWFGQWNTNPYGNMVVIYDTSMTQSIIDSPVSLNDYRYYTIDGMAFHVNLMTTSTSTRSMSSTYTGQIWPIQDSELSGYWYYNAANTVLGNYLIIDGGYKSEYNPTTSTFDYIYGGPAYRFKYDYF